MFRSLVLICFIILGTAVHAQFEVFQQRVRSRDSINIYDGREKIFIDHDRPQYNLNDTLWLKGYMVTAGLLIPNDSSRIVYVELIDAKGELAKRISIMSQFGMFYSNITLTDKLFSQGIYTLRAYTNRMRNFGDSLFFETDFKIIDPSAGLWRATLNNMSFANNRLSAAIALKSEGRRPLANDKVNVQLISKNKVLFRKRMVTDASGNIYIDTLLKNASPGNTRLEISNKNLQLQIPVPYKSQALDLQFLPEGGSFVAGIKQAVGFKAVDIYGRGADVKGVIKDSKGSAVCSFASVHKGMGVVWMLPAANETYTAYLNNGAAYQLPVVEPSASMLQVLYNDSADSIIVNVHVTPGMARSIVYITGSVRGGYYATAKLQNKENYCVKLATKDFPSGVARITLYNDEQIPINERAVFIWHNDVLGLALTPNKAVYLNKDSVMLNLSVKNSAGQQVMGSFSVSVIDTSQVQLSQGKDNIVSYMLLSSDLKGAVEDPYYYIKNPVGEAINALMLTQGWVKYDFENITREFAYEKGFEISGKATNLLNKPLANTKVTIFGRDGKGIFFGDTTTNRNGIFTFSGFPLFVTDTVSTMIKAVNKNNKSFGVGINVFDKNYAPIPAPREMYDENSIVFDTAAKRSIDMRARLLEQIRRDGRMLEEVVVTAKARIPGSQNLNDGADQTISQAVLEKTPKKTLLDVLKEKVPGFREGTLPKSQRLEYFINSNKVRFIFDGMDLDFYYHSTTSMSDDYLQFLNGYLQYYTAEDIKGIEIMNNPRYNSSYKSRYLEAGEQMNYSAATRDISFIEITTHGGVGPFLKKVPGMYLLKPVAPFIGKQFYSPRYTSANEETAFPDLRQTVYWNPNVISDKNGAANISFYTSETKGHGYIVIIQGADLKGEFGVLAVPLKIRPE
ncbi:MAG: Plug domain-containing protein [Niabella sp.]